MSNESNLQVSQEPVLEIAFTEPVAVSFPITEKTDSVTNSLADLWNFQTSVYCLNHLTFCFSFSLKHFVYFAVLNAPVALMF